MNTTILSVLTGLAGMVGWGLHDFLGGVFAKRIGPARAFFWSQLAGLVFVLLLAAVLGTRVSIPASVILLLPVGALLYAVGYLLFFRGLEIGNVSIVAATMNLWAVVTMLFAFAFMGQRLTPVQTVGALMVITGATLASLRLSDIGARAVRFSAGVRETALGAVLFGVFWGISQMMSERAGWLLATLLVKIGVVLIVLIYLLLVRREPGLADMPTKTRFAVALMGVIEAGAVAVVNFGLTVGDAILISPIASALSVVTITLAMVFLKERVTRLQGFGMIMALVGIVVTAL